MDGVHDMGGMHGFGGIPEDDASFHADWERTAYALNKLLRMQGHYNSDEYRHSVERMDPASYLAASYFERWFTGVERLVVEKGLLSEAEIDARTAAIRAGEYDAEGDEDEGPSGAGAVELHSEAADADDELVARARETFRRGAASGRDGQTDARTPRFEPGDDVAVRNVHPPGHTRAPRYCRRTTGTVRRVVGEFALPDASAHGEHRVEPVYVVEFDANDLWGAETDADAVNLDMWESYLTASTR